MKTCIAVLAVVCLLIPLGVCAQKIEVDPNTPQVAKPAVVEAADERLAQKISYQSTDKRLYAVIAELSEKTGVTICCGKSDEDWQVRDLPVVISWKDMPLGKLLQVITNSTHTSLTSSLVDNAVVYRIVRDDQVRKRVDDNIAKWRKSQLDLASWTWDAWVAFGALPDAEVKSTGADEMQVGSGAYQVARDLAQIIAKLSPATRDRIFAGEATTLTSSKGPLAQQVSELYNNWWSLRQEGYLKFVSENQDLIRNNPELVIDDPKALTEEDLKKASLQFELRGGDNPLLVMKLDGPAGAAENPFPDPRAWVNDMVPNFAQAPQTPDIGVNDTPSAFSDFDMENPQVLALSQLKVKLAKPVEGQEQYFADVVAAFAQASGYSVVCEDFKSHTNESWLDTYAGLYGTEVPASDVLSQMQASGDAVKWYIDQQDKLIVGFSSAWYERHERMVPESFVAYLREKLDGSGVDIDEAVVIRRLTEGQYTDWVRGSRDLKALAWECAPRDEPIWDFYDSLSAEYKAQAKSESGLALAAFNGKVLAQLFEDVEKGVAKQDHWGMVSLAKSSPEFVKEHPELNGSVIIPTDPNVLSKLTLYVRTQEINPVVGLGMNSKDMTIKRYAIEIKGDGTTMKFEGPMLDFPIYSKKREQIVREEKLKLTENKQ